MALSIAVGRCAAVLAVLRELAFGEAGSCSSTPATG